MAYEHPIRVPVRPRRRRWRGPVTLLVLLGLLAGATYWAWDSVRGPDPVVARACVGAIPLQASAVRVNVFNATARVGLARRTGDALADRGFQVGTIGNYPGSRVRSVAVVRSGPQGRAAAALVRQQLPSSEVQVNRERKGADVDLIVGARYTALAPLRTAPPTC